jgi:DNA-binding NarL/FixJ family response regulator
MPSKPQKIHNMKDFKHKIAIIEDLKEVAMSLQTYINLEEDMECQHIYHNAEDAIAFIPKTDINLVLVDIGLPRASGIDAIQAIKGCCPHILFCMFTVYEDDEKIFKSLQAGAKGYILKGASKEKIVIALRELAEGGSPMSPTIARKIIDIFNASKLQMQNHDLPLTPREIDLLNLLAKGLLYKEIADKMNITVGTVKQHIHKIYEKLQVNNKTEAINKFKFFGN